MEFDINAFLFVQIITTFAFDRLRYRGLFV